MRTLVRLIIGLGIMLSVSAFCADNWHFECVDPKSPGAREGARMVYDSANDSLILFGRYQYLFSSHTSADMWTWTLSSGWTLDHLSNTPSMTRRGYGSFAYDAARNTAVWFGGMTGTTEHDQTWTWNGSAWTLQNPASAPPDSDPSFACPMAYDSIRNVCVLVADDKTWEWDGTTWTQIPTTVLPGADDGSAMAFDSHRQRMVLFASDFLNPYARTLEYDGVDWELKSPATVVLEHSYSTMFYDSVRQKTIMFGGFVDTGVNRVCNDTYQWDGTDWTLLAPAQSPPPGADYASAFHQGLGTGMIINGIALLDVASTFESGMWSWDGTTWTPMTPGTRPSQRYNAAMSWDSDRERIVLFGGSGISYSGYDTDTWEFDGTEWTLMTPSVHPPAFTDTGLGDMAFHEAEGITFLVTGTDPVQTWMWNGTDWSQAITSPVTGDGYPLDSIRFNKHRMIMVSGNYTYRWTSLDWSEIVGANTPASTGFNRYDLAFDSNLNRFVMLVSGASGYSDTWLFDADVWVNSGLVVPLDEPRLACDGVSGKTVAVGGYAGITLNEEIWTFDGTGWTGYPTVDLGGPEGRWRPSLCAHDTGLYYFAGRNDGIKLNELWTITWEKAVPALDALGASDSGDRSVRIADTN